MFPEKRVACSICHQPPNTQPQLKVGCPQSREKGDRKWYLQKHRHRKGLMTSNGHSSRVFLKFIFENLLSELLSGAGWAGEGTKQQKKITDSLSTQNFGQGCSPSFLLVERNEFFIFGLCFVFLTPPLKAYLS